VSTTGHRVKKFRYDGSKEFACEKVRRVLNDRDIKLLLSVLNMPVQNGVAQRENHTVVELARSMLSVRRLPKPMWAQACETAVYVLILTGKTPVIRKSPMEMWNGHVIKNLDHLCVFGMECHVYIPKQFWKKFYNKSVFGRMISYLNDKDGYQVYVPSLNNIVHSRIYLKPERVFHSSVVETGLDNAAVEDVVAHLWKM